MKTFELESDMTSWKRGFYINGTWIEPAGLEVEAVVNPATEEAIAEILMAGELQVNEAVAAAKAAFQTWRKTTKSERRAFLVRLLESMERRSDEFARTISLEMGAPIDLARDVHTQFVGIGRLKETIASLDRFEDVTTTSSGATYVLHQPVGVCALITPWNWPLNQIAQKVFPALAVGCTMVLKPSSLSPLDAILLTECIDEAGFPKGVFNLIHGAGSRIGSQLSSHPDVDMVSLTGSTRAGISVMENAAKTIKRVSLELGGKSPNIVFADADLDKAATWGVQRVMMNSGQTCTAPTRMLVERPVYDAVVEKAAAVCQAIKIGDPSQHGAHMGPVVSAHQFDTIQNYIRIGIDEGARLVAGGLGKPEGLNRGFYVRPTVFADVTNDMTIAREEIFGPVLVILPFEDEEDAIRIANDSPFGLAGHVHTNDPDRAQRVARALDAGMIGVNGQGQGVDAPFGGFKMSGIGREGSDWGLHDFLEIKSVTGVAV